MSINLVNTLKNLLGPGGWLEGPDVTPYSTDIYGQQGHVILVARPENTSEVSQTVSACAKAGVQIIPQGGNTNVCRMAVPLKGQEVVILSLARMNRIINVDPECSTITAEAGCIMQTLQAAAIAADRIFAPDWGARGTAMVGGAVATNGGGQNVLRYGTTREQVLGMEVVLPDGRIWDGMRALRKDNSGYDLKHLFIGSEGTLGVITKLVFKLHPYQPVRQSMIAILADMGRLMEFLDIAQGVGGEKLVAFELMPGIGIEKALKRYPDLQRPLNAKSDWYVLIKLTGKESVEEHLAEIFEAGFEKGILEDAVISQNLAQENNLWEIREQMIPKQYFERRLLKWDVSVPINKIVPFLDASEQIAKKLQKTAISYAVGHVGDGNIHYSIFPEGEEGPELDALSEKYYREIDALVWSHGGSIVAEHGVGALFIDRVRSQKSGIEMELMQLLRKSFDPQGIMNPGKLIA